MSPARVNNIMKDFNSISLGAHRGDFETGLEGMKTSSGRGGGVSVGMFILFFGGERRNLDALDVI